MEALARIREQARGCEALPPADAAYEEALCSFKDSAAEGLGCVGPRFIKWQDSGLQSVQGMRSGGGLPVAAVHSAGCLPAHAGGG